LAAAPLDRWGPDEIQVAMRKEREEVVEATKAPAKRGSMKIK
jgi:hypothetical protein